MRILTFAAYYYPHIGGYIKNIHELSKRLVEKGYSVTIVTCNTDSADAVEVMDGVKVIRLPVWDIPDRAVSVPKPSLSLFRLCFTKSDYDVVLTQARIFTMSLLGAVYAKVHRIPLIHVERGGCHGTGNGRIATQLLKVYDHTIGSWLVRSADRRVGISQAACDLIEHVGGKNARVIYNGMDVNDKTQLGRILDGTTVIIYVGRLIYAKGVQDLLEAFNLCCNQYNNLMLWIVGNGNYKDKLKAQASRSPYSNCIKFCGQLDYRTVMGTLAIADIFVNPSYSEGLPTSVLEAASVGLPIVATDIGGTREIIDDDISGLLVEPRDVEQLALKITALASDKNYAKRLGEEAKTTVIKKFNWDRITGQWEEILKEVAN